MLKKYFFIPILWLSLTAVVRAQDLFAFIREGNIEQVRIMIDGNPALMNIPNNAQYWPLTYASLLGKDEIVDYLITKGADPNSKGSSVFSPLYYAVFRGHLNVVEALLKAGADLSQSTLGMSLLHTAVITKNRPMAELLVSKGISINLKDKYGLTALHMASELGLSEMSLFLLSRGADPNLRDKQGATPLHLAEESSQPEILGLLLNHGARALSRNFPVWKGPYLGEKMPGLHLERCPLNSVLRIIGPHSGIAIAKDGKEVYWVRGDYSGKIWWTQEVDGVWTAPRMAPFSGLYDDSYPRFSNDGKKLYFTSDRPRAKDGKRDEGVGDIWYVEKKPDGWGEPVNAGDAVNTENDEFIASLGRKGTLFFTRTTVQNGQRSVDIYRALLTRGHYDRAEVLGTSINSDKMDVGPFIAPDGSYMIFSSERFGGMTTCVSFLKESGTWTPAQDIQYLFAPFTASYPQGITADGKYILFAGRDGKEWDIYWMSAKAIENLRPRN
jgi:hypothetical protein